MNRNTLRSLLVVGGLIFIGITASQYIFLSKAYELQEKVMNQDIAKALGRVRRNILHEFTHANDSSGLKQLSKGYFVVHVDDKINPNELKKLLKQEFARMGILMDFQFAIYDTMQHKLVFGDYISKDHLDRRATPVPDLPKYHYDRYYFCVYFPFKTNFVLQEMKVWILLSILLLGVVVFFSYALFVIFKQKRLSEIHKDFVNNMTHEFQTPISTIYLSSEVIKEPSIIDTPQRLQVYATIIQVEALKLKKQVESILQMDRMGDNGIVLHKEKIQLHEHVQNVVAYALAHLDMKGGKIDVELGADPSAILFDPNHFFNMLYNLVDNAIKYTENIPRITIKTNNKKKGIELSISDNGIGLKKEDLKKVFDKFYRTNTDFVNTNKGFGIGLYYVRTVIKAHKGTIKVESTPNKGSTFLVWLPCTDENA